MSRAKKKLWSAAEIRFELYGIMNQLRAEQNEQLAWVSAHGGHAKNCLVCAKYEAKRQAIERAIRHFARTDP